MFSGTVNRPKYGKKLYPLGNGRLGAMVFREAWLMKEFKLNVKFFCGTVTSLDPNNPEGVRALPEVQRLIFENKNNEAVQLAGKKNDGHPKGVRPYQSIGRIMV